MKICHFYLVFNPLLNENDQHPTQAHEFYWNFKEKIEQEETSHFYWGKIRKSPSSTPLKIENYKEVIANNKEAGFDTYLFISDFSNFWVAKVEDACLDITDKQNTLGFYWNETVEIWFKVTDFHLLCTGRETFERISELCVDNQYSEKTIESVNPYLGGLRYPLVVEDRRGEDYFQSLNASGSVLRIKEHNPLLESNGIEEVELLKKTVTSYTIPQANFLKLPDIIQKQIVWSEHLYSQIKWNSEMETKSLEEVAFSYLRTLEGLLNSTLMHELKDLTQGDIKDKRKFKLIDMDKESTHQNYRDINKRGFKIQNSQSIKEIANAITSRTWEDTNLDNVFRGTSMDTFWNACRKEVGPALESLITSYKIIDFRNGQAHLDAHDPVGLNVEEALSIRNKILGVGCTGLINMIIEDFPKKLKSKKNEKAA